MPTSYTTCLNCMERVTSESGMRDTRCHQCPNHEKVYSYLFYIEDVTLSYKEKYCANKIQLEINRGQKVVQENDN